MDFALSLIINKNGFRVFSLERYWFIRVWFSYFVWKYR